jgi:hypothetical protein
MVGERFGISSMVREGRLLKLRLPDLAAALVKIEESHGLWLL